MLETAPLVLIGALALGYLLGSIPFGLVLTRSAGLGDIRAIGSGNIGATNVLRTGNKKLAAATLLLDGLKGTVAVLLAPGSARSRRSPPASAPSSAMSSRSGSASRAARASPPSSACCSPSTGPPSSSSPASGSPSPMPSAIPRSRPVASAATPVVLLLMGRGWPTVIVFAGLAALLIAKHHQNIAKLLAGTESRIGEKSAAPPA